MKYYSLSVLDFIDEAKQWDKDSFLRKTNFHKEELKKLDVNSIDSVYFGCSREIWHLIDFCRKILYYNEYFSYPAGMSDEDYSKMIDLLAFIESKE